MSKKNFSITTHCLAYRIHILMYLPFNMMKTIWQNDVWLIGHGGTIHQTRKITAFSRKRFSENDSVYPVRKSKVTWLLYMFQEKEGLIRCVHHCDLKLITPWSLQSSGQSIPKFRTGKTQPRNLERERERIEEVWDTVRKRSKAQNEAQDSLRVGRSFCHW